MYAANILFVISLHVGEVSGYCATWNNQPNHISERFQANLGFKKSSKIKSAVGRFSMISAHGADKDEISRETAMRTISKRFPRRIQEAIQQASECTICALDHGVCRVNLQLQIVEFDMKSRPQQAGSEMMHFLNHLGSALVQRGMRINFIFNSVVDMANARRLIREDIEQNVKLNVLGVGAFGHTEDIAILVCPCNEGNENLGRIEAVERLLYSGPPSSLVSRRCRKEYLQRPIIMINPSLEAIHPHSSTHKKVVPMFMSDFETAYYLDPHIMDHHGGRGKHYAGLLKAYPSKDWQLWLKPGNREEFKLIWQRSQRPSEADLSPFLNGEI
eukprot:CAMPEP_0172178098 /NCGR_PEP_ID=MMETSP1050-20130122/15828_1 /TAXON_ID=233186 /ORGANISM="Cryptomonas curvata, Strain CCAP979/52" /LENGTH=329 /DNA_ID=CAMNT_0012850741 /DNA_START=180 /DNA_END=1169 /DNA_ORIENTATION=-